MVDYRFTNSDRRNVWRSEREMALAGQLAEALDSKIVNDYHDPVPVRLKAPFVRV
jgi:hypothetical protein